MRQVEFGFESFHSNYSKEMPVYTMTLQCVHIYIVKMILVQHKCENVSKKKTKLKLILYSFYVLISNRCFNQFKYPFSWFWVILELLIKDTREQKWFLLVLKFFSSKNNLKTLREWFTATELLFSNYPEANGSLAFLNLQI